MWALSIKVLLKHGHSRHSVNQNNWMLEQKQLFEDKYKI